MNKPRPALVLLTPGFPASDSDSSCLPSLQILTRSLQDRCPQCEIIILSFQYPYHSDPYSWQGIRVIPFGGRNRGGLMRLLLRKRIYSTLEKIREQQGIAGLLSFWLGECALLGNRFGKKYGIRHFCSIRGQDARKGNRLVRQVRPMADELIAISESLRDEFESNYGISPAHLIVPGFGEGPDSRGAERKWDILAVGSLIPLKRFDIFLDVLSDLVRVFPAICALLIGEGPERKNLQALIREKGIEANIRLTGELSHNEVLNHMRQSRLLLHTSSYEGFSGVCQEALWAGCHVISFTRAMKAPISQWEIVKTRQEMITSAIKVLSDRSCKFDPIIICTEEEAARKHAELFSF